MAKQHGLASQIFVDNASSAAKDISNDITSFTVSTPRGEQDITGIDKSAMERLLVLADGKVSLKGVFNAAADKSHAIFSTVPSTSVARLVTINFPPIATGSPVLAMTVQFADYTVDRNDKGELVWSTEGMLSNGSVPTWTTHA